MKDHSKKPTDDIKYRKKKKRKWLEKRSMSLKTPKIKDLSVLLT